MNFAIAILIVLSGLSAIRILRGPSLWDRLLGLNLVTSKFVMLMILLATIRHQSFLLDTALIYALLSFMGIIFIAIYVQRKGRY